MTNPKDPQAEAFKKANEALNNAKVPTEDRQVMDADDPRVFNPLAAQTDIGEVISGILESFRVRTLEKQDKGNKRDATKALLALFQAHQQQAFESGLQTGYDAEAEYQTRTNLPKLQQELLSELLGEAIEYDLVTYDFGTALVVGKQKAVPVSVIQSKIGELNG